MLVSYGWHNIIKSLKKPFYIKNQPKNPCYHNYFCFFIGTCTFMYWYTSLVFSYIINKAYRVWLRRLYYVAGPQAFRGVHCRLSDRQHTVVLPRYGCKFSFKWLRLACVLYMTASYKTLIKSYSLIIIHDCILYFFIHLLIQCLTEWRTWSCTPINQKVMSSYTGDG